jgi:hypothetical protein
MPPVLNSIIFYETGKTQAQLTLSYYLRKICIYQQAGCCHLDVLRGDKFWGRGLEEGPWFIGSVSSKSLLISPFQFKM